MGVIDILTSWSGEALHAIIAGAEQGGAENIDG